MRKPFYYQPMKNLDERETMIKDFAKKDVKNEND